MNRLRNAILAIGLAGVAPAWGAPARTHGLPVPPGLSVPATGAASSALPPGFV